MNKAKMTAELKAEIWKDAPPDALWHGIHDDGQGGYCIHEKKPKAEIWDIGGCWMADVVGPVSKPLWKGHKQFPGDWSESWTETLTQRPLRTISYPPEKNPEPRYVTVHTGRHAGRTGLVTMIYYDYQHTGDSPDLLLLDDVNGGPRFDALSTEVDEADPPPPTPIPAPQHTLYEGNVLHSLCCHGHDWTVLHVAKNLLQSIDDDGNKILFDSFWGKCDNDNCRCGSHEYRERCHYCGVSNDDDDGITERALDIFDDILEAMEMFSFHDSGSDEQLVGVTNDTRSYFDYAELLGIWCDLMDYPAWVVDVFRAL